MIADTLRSNLKSIVGSYRQATGASLAQVSRRFYGNASFLEAFFRGKQSISVDKFDEVVDALKAVWPPDAEWPVTAPVIIIRPRKRSDGKTFSAA